LDGSYLGQPENCDASLKTELLALGSWASVLAYIHVPQIEHKKDQVFEVNPK